MLGRNDLPSPPSETDVTITPSHSPLLFSFPYSITFGFCQNFKCYHPLSPPFSFLFSCFCFSSVHLFFLPNETGHCFPYVRQGRGAFYSTSHRPIVKLGYFEQGSQSGERKNDKII